LTGTLNNLANAHGALGDAQTKKTLLERALKIQEQHYGKDHWYVTGTLNNLANAHGALGDAQEQRKLLERALKINEQHYGKDHWQVAIVLAGLGLAHRDLGEHHQSIILTKRALFIFKKHYGEDHPEVARILMSLGATYACLGSMQQAKTLLEQALPRLEKYYGKEHPHVALTLMNLGVVHLNSGNIQQAKILFEQALPQLEKYYGKEHPHVALTLMNLGAVHLNSGNIQQAKILFEQALPLFEQNYGKEHLQVARTLMNLGATYITLGSMQQGKTLLEQALPRLEKYYGKEHPEVALTLMNLGVMYKELGDEKQAFSLAQQAYTMFLKVYPDPFHPHTQKAQALLEMTLEPIINQLCLPEILKLLQQKEESVVRFFEDQGVDINEPTIHLMLMTRYVSQQNIQGAICHAQILLNLFEIMEQPVNGLHQTLACYYHSYAHEQLAAKNHLTVQETIAQAELHFKKSIEFLPSMSVYTDYANFLLRQQRVTDAVQQLQYAITLSETLALESSETTDYLTYSSMDRATLDINLQAELDYWKSLTLKTTHFAYYLLITAYPQQSDQSAARTALAVFQKLADTDNSPLTFSLLGHTYRALGDYATAITCYQCALKLEPDYVVAEQQIAYCKQRCETASGDSKLGIPSAAQVESKRADTTETKTDTIVIALEERSLGYVQRLQHVLGTIPSGVPIVQHGEKSLGSRWVSFSSFWLKQLPPKAIAELSEELHVSEEQFRHKAP